MELHALISYWSMLRMRLQILRADDRGMTTEAVLITAGLAALAITVLTVLVAKVTSKANSISTDTP